MTSPEGLPVFQRLSPDWPDLSPDQPELVDTPIHPDQQVLDGCPQKLAPLITVTIKSKSKDPLAGSRSSHTAEARSLVRDWWETQHPRPIQKFVVVCQVVERALGAGWSPELIREAMDNVPTISARWLEGYVNRHRRGRRDGLEAVRRHLAASDDRQELS